MCAEFFLGHDIDANHYNKIMQLHPEYAEEQYIKAMPFLNIVSEDPRKVALEKVRELEEKTSQIPSLEAKYLEQQQMIQGLTMLVHRLERTLNEKLDG